MIEARHKPVLADTSLTPLDGYRQPEDGFKQRVSGSKRRDWENRPFPTKERTPKTPATIENSITAGPHDIAAVTTEALPTGNGTTSVTVYNVNRL